MADTACMSIPQEVTNENAITLAKSCSLPCFNELLWINYKDEGKACIP